MKTKLALCKPVCLKPNDWLVNTQKPWLHRNSVRAAQKRSALAHYTLYTDLGIEGGTSLTHYAVHTT